VAVSATTISPDAAVAAITIAAAAVAATTANFL
jgi:hypothetical protein